MGADNSCELSYSLEELVPSVGAWSGSSCVTKAALTALWSLTQHTLQRLL